MLQLQLQPWTPPEIKTGAKALAAHIFPGKTIDTNEEAGSAITVERNTIRPIFVLTEWKEQTSREERVSLII